MKIRYEETKPLAVKALVNAGASTTNAEIQVEHLIEAELRGRASHGLLRLPRLVERIQNKVLDPVAQGCSSWVSKGFLQVNGEMGFGPVVAYNALNEALKRIDDLGVCVVAIDNNNHLGMMALYAEYLALKGITSLGFSTSEALVHPWGGTKALLGTNPIAIGVPTEKEPFVLDMATSLVAMGTIHDYANRNEEIPEGWALNAQGEATTDPNQAKHGAIAPFGEAKGYALGLAFEVLVASLTASALGTDVVGTLDSHKACNKGDLFILISPPQAGISTAVANYLENIRQSPPAEPGGKVLIPGDRAQAQRARSLAEGFTIPQALWGELEKLAR